MNEHKARIKVVSITLAPMTLPTDIDDCFLMIDAIAVTNSGSEVPIATMVTPMMASDTPQEVAILLPLLTRSCDPIMIAAAPTITREIFRIMLFFRFIWKFCCFFIFTLFR